MPPPNTPEEGLVPTTNVASLALRPVTYAVDLRALEYEGNIDENLICPICRVAFVSPVITKCDHVFCHRCLAQAHALNPVCPIDRIPLKLDSEITLAPKLVNNQLDNLVVRCPNRCRGCDLLVARSLVENHVTRYCDKTLVPCPHPACAKMVARKDAAKGCLHYEVLCEYCNRWKEKADLEEHQDNKCPDRKTNCKLCNAEFVRHKLDEHMKECPEAQTPCDFAPFGCTRQTSRKDLDEHTRICEYRVVGPVGKQLAELQTELGILKEKDRLKERRIKFLENKGFPIPTAPAETITNLNLPETSTNADNAPYDSRDQYFLSLFETMESKVERLSSALNEVEGRHSMMLFNESLQIKDQLTEIRSTMGVLGMHVRWLMNFRLQERGGRVGTASPNLPGTLPDARDNNADAPPSMPRRLSDSLRENPARL